LIIRSKLSGYRLLPTYNLLTGFKSSYFTIGMKDDIKTLKYIAGFIDISEDC